MIRLRAPAKLNLALRVGRRGDDGYHAVATVLQTMSLSDILYARIAGEDERPDPGQDLAARDVALLRVDGAELRADNTVAQAVAAMAVVARDHGARTDALAMRLVKRIPMGAGLGGGSSDAVAAMAACARLWRLDVRRLESSGALQRIAEEVGSDVAFFLTGGTALATGRGERIAPVDPLPPTWFVVAAPALHVSTPDAYQAFDNDSGAGEIPAQPPVPSYEPRLDAAWMGNDLASPVGASYPDVAATRRRLEESGGRCAQMTGSGAASFAAFPDRRSAGRAAAALRKKGLWARPSQSITADQQRRSLFVEQPARGVLTGEEIDPPDV